MHREAQGTRKDDEGTFGNVLKTNTVNMLNKLRHVLLTILLLVAIT